MKKVVKKVFEFFEELWYAELILLSVIFIGILLFIENFFLKIVLLVHLIRGFDPQEVISFTVRFSENHLSEEEKNVLPEELRNFLYTAVFWPIKIG